MCKKVFCDNCNFQFSGSPSSDKDACPKCGSKEKKFVLFFEDSLQIKENLQGKVLPKRKMSENSKRKKYPLEFDIGDDFSVKKQKWVKKTRVINREGDQYSEEVIDPETKEIIHRCSEPLSKHQGHGSAKETGGEKSANNCEANKANQNAKRDTDEQT